MILKPLLQATLVGRQFSSSANSLSTTRAHKKTSTSFPFPLAGKFNFGYKDGYSLTNARHFVVVVVVVVFK